MNRQKYTFEYEFKSSDKLYSKLIESSEKRVYSYSEKEIYNLLGKSNAIKNYAINIQSLKNFVYN